MIAPLYGACMMTVRHRLDVVDQVMDGEVQTGHENLDLELIFLHLRKALESTAFASLSANKKKYSAVHARYSNH